MSLNEKSEKDFQKNEDYNIPSRVRFSAEEDAKLIELQQEKLDWHEISTRFENRSPRQCRERFQNYLSPELNKSNWTRDEDELLIKKESEMGKKWKKMMPYFQNRSNVNIKNRFTTLQNRKNAKEKFLQQSIDEQNRAKVKNIKNNTTNCFNSYQQLQQIQQDLSYQQNVYQNQLNIINQMQKMVEYQQNMQIQYIKQKNQSEQLEKPQLQMAQQQKPMQQSEKIQQPKHMQQNQNIDKIDQKQEQIPKPENESSKKNIDNVFENQEMKNLWDFVDCDFDEMDAFY